MAVYLLLQTRKMWFRILLNLKTNQKHDILVFEYICVNRSKGRKYFSKLNKIRTYWWLIASRGSWKDKMYDWKVEKNLWEKFDTFRDKKDWGFIDALLYIYKFFFFSLLLSRKECFLNSISSRCCSTNM